MSAEAEPRRSVRSTKGQHKGLDQLDQPIEPKRRGRKKKSEKQEEPEETEDEIIRCVCGATDQEGEDPAEPWIACDKCAVWQHNVCMGKSIYDEDLTSEYFCELCKPEDHRELLDGMARGEKPWVARRKAKMEEEEEENKKKRKGGRKSKGAAGKRLSDARSKDDAGMESSPAPTSSAPAGPASSAPDSTAATLSASAAVPTTTGRGTKSSPMPPPVSPNRSETNGAATALGQVPETKKDGKKEPKKDVKKEGKKEAGVSAAKAGTGPGAGSPAAGVTGIKRKSRGVSEDDRDHKKLRKVSETQAVPVSDAADGAPAAGGTPPPVPVGEVALPEPPPPPKLVKYDPPEDLPASIAELLDTRQGPAKALKKNISAALMALEKAGKFSPEEGVTAAQTAERFAIQIERAVQDTHANAKEYGAQVKTLAFNLKNNTDLVQGLLQSTLSPPMLAVMTTDQLASKELQRETAEMKARAEKQSILITDDGPRMRKTHKGEEIVENEQSAGVDESGPSGSSRRMLSASTSVPRGGVPSDHDGGEEHSSGGDPMDVEVELPADLEFQRPQVPPLAPAAAGKDGGLRIDPARHSPKTEFDIKKVFSKVRSPTQPLRRMSHPAPPSRGPGVDPEVDRLLEDDGAETPPYSPTEEIDPDVIWRGVLEMPNVAKMQVTSKFMGGGNLNKAYGLPWGRLFPPSVTVAGRLDQQQATVYLCGMRWRATYDLVVASLVPAHEGDKQQFRKVVDYFVSRRKYGVVKDKASDNVKDQYIMPLLPGDELPEVMLNLEDNVVPQVRTEPMLLIAFVYENDREKLQSLQLREGAAATAADATSGGQAALLQQNQLPPHASAAQTPQTTRHPSISAPTFSPNTPQGGFPPAFGNGQGAAHGQPQPQPFPPGPAFTPSPHQAPVNPAAPVAGGGYDNGHGAAAAGGVNHALGPIAPTTYAQAHAQGVEAAREILGPLIECATVQILLPQASRMTAVEWTVVRKKLEAHPAAQHDIRLLSTLLSEAEPTAAEGRQPVPQRSPTLAPPAPPQQHSRPSEPLAQAPGASLRAPLTPPTISSVPAGAAAASTLAQGQTLPAAQRQQQQPPRPPAPAVSQTPIPIPHVPHTPQVKSQLPARTVQPPTSLPATAGGEGAASSGIPPAQAPLTGS